MKSATYSLLTKFDVFAQPVSFYFQGSLHHKTKLSGFLSLLMYALVSLIFCYECYLLFSRSVVSAPLVTTYNIIPPEPSNSPDTANNVFVVVSHDDSSISFDNSIFNINFEHITSGYNSDGSTYSIRASFVMAPCQISSFQGFEAQFTQKKFDKALCLAGPAGTVDPNETSPLFGDNNSPQMGSSQMRVTPCVNGTSPNVTCASPSTISNYLKNTPKITIKLNMLNAIVNSGNYENPITFYYQEISWYLSPGALVTETDILIRSVSVTTVSDYFGLGKGSTMIAAFYDQERRDRIYVPSAGEQTFLVMNFLASNYSDSYTRRYLTFGDMFTMIGGIWAVLNLIVGFFAVSYNRLVYQKKLADIIYENTDTNGSAGPPKVSGFKIEAKEKQSGSTELPLLVSEQETKENPKTVLKIPDSLEIKTKFSSRWKILCCCRKKNSKEERKPPIGELLKRYKRVKNEVDIISLLKRLKDIENNVKEWSAGIDTPERALKSPKKITIIRAESFDNKQSVKSNRTSSDLVEEQIPLQNNNDEHGEKKEEGHEAEASRVE